MVGERVRVKKLCQRAKNRGTKEVCELLGRYANARLHHFDNISLNQFEELLGLSDWEIFDLILGLQSAPESLSSIVTRIRSWVNSEYQNSRQINES